MRLLLILAIFITSMPVYAVDRPSSSHEVYFAGSNYELHVYTVNGRRDGNTMLIIGGIQGDEPGGYLSADLYSKLQLEQGNLIVIPRANLKSVILFDRWPDGDMNRQFVDNITDNEMNQVVKVIIKYMQQADILLNLHDGWGFHSPTYINSQRNPNRFGQSIIVDEDVYVCADNTTINLKSMVSQVLEATNAKITDEGHMLAYFNTRTGDSDTRFKDMQKTATWYALKNFCIPAFGIEASKNISTVEQKILYHNYVINEFMRIMNIIPEQPPIFTTPAILDFALLTVNGNAITVHDGDTITVNKNDTLVVSHIETNYSRGISCDVLGHGNLNDISKEFTITHATKIVFRKEDAKFAEVTINVTDSSPVASIEKPYQFFLELNGVLSSYPSDRAVQVKNGDVLKIVRIEKDGEDLNLPMNLRGWVPPNATSNDGDDRGYTINVNIKDMLSRFASDKSGKIYPITVDDKDGKEIARIFIEF